MIAVIIILGVLHHRYSIAQARMKMIETVKWLVVIALNTDCSPAN